MASRRPAHRRRLDEACGTVAARGADCGKRAGGPAALSADLIQLTSPPSLSAAHAGTQYSSRCARPEPVVVVPIKDHILSLHSVNTLLILSCAHDAGRDLVELGMACGHLVLERLGAGVIMLVK